MLAQISKSTETTKIPKFPKISQNTAQNRCLEILNEVPTEYLRSFLTLLDAYFENIKEKTNFGYSRYDYPPKYALKLPAEISKKYCCEIVNNIPAEYLENLQRYLEECLNDLEEADDEAFCLEMLSEHERSPDKDDYSGSLTVEELVHELGLNMEDIENYEDDEDEI
ncbi:MAG: hypothetical protein FWG64_03915 [Firmicutes bacterium]|nr:hypothetical protein [Bacillota bacterium]